jgi:succinyl-CoA synthetase alpha subunit
MSILVNKDTKIIVQGLTGKTGTFHTEQALEYYGTKMVAGVHPKKGGETWSAGDDRRCRAADLRLRWRSQGSHRRRRIRDLRPAGRRGRCDHRGDRRGSPVHRLHHRRHSGADMVKVKAKLEKSKSRLLGPNCPGILTPEECKIGIMPGSIFKKGSVGVVSRSGTLTYEAVFQTSNAGPRPDHGCRHRRRPGQGHRVHRRPGDVPWPTMKPVDHHDR